MSEQTTSMTTTRKKPTGKTPPAVNATVAGGHKYVRGERGKFVPGTKVQPAKQRFRRTMLREEFKAALAELSPTRNLGETVRLIVQNLARQAIAGDPQSPSLVFSRLIPPLKPTSAPIKLHGATLNTPPSEIATRLACEASTGLVTLDDAAQLGAVLAHLGEINQQLRMEERLQETEAQIKALQRATKPVRVA